MDIPSSSTSSKDDRRTFINRGEDDELELVYYRTSKLRLALACVGALIPPFLLALIFYWRRDWLVKCIAYRCSVSEATWVLLQDRHGQVFAHMIHTLVTSEAVRNALTMTGVKLDQQQTRDIKAHKNAKGFRVQRFFRHQKLKYIFSDENQQFEKISVPPMQCSYFLQAKGLTYIEQQNNKWIFGENAIRVHVTPVIILLITQALNPFYVFQLFSILLWAAGEAYYYYAGCIGFLTIVSLAAQIIQQRMMERALKKTIAYSRNCFVWREDLKNWTEVSSESLVPGDVIQIQEANDCVMPCDVILTSGSCIMNESMLTGESVPMTKVAMETSEDDVYFDIKEHSRHVLFAGTNVIQLRRADNEHVKGVVYRTGFSTAKGELVRSILFPKPMDFKFTKDSYKYVGFLAGLALVGMIYTIVVKIMDGDSAGNIVIRTLDLVTIVVPPALPAAMTCGIGFAQFRLRRSRIFCISPNSINVCGSLDVFCFDKTGTLTEDGLDLLSIRQATNGTFDLDLRVDMEKKQHGEAELGQHQQLMEELIVAMATCHSLAVVNGNLSGDPLDLKMFEFTNWELEEASSSSSSSSSTGNSHIVAPIIVRPKASSNTSSQTTAPQGASALSSPARAAAAASFVPEVGILRQFTFSSKLQRMSVITHQRTSTGGATVDRFTCYAKGSPEMIASLSSKESVPCDFEKILINYTSQGFRVLALAMKPLFDASPSDVINDVTVKIRQITREEVEGHLTFLGLLVMENRLKMETTPVIHQLRSANIRTIMVTGDNMLTALNVARECRMLDQGQRVIVTSVSPIDAARPSEVLWCTVNLPELERSPIAKNVDPEAFCFEENHRYAFAVTGKSWGLLRQHHPQLLPRVVARGAVFARFSPDQKKQLIEELQEAGHFVGMCGDGANDCGALKAAHAGISLSEAEASVASPFTSKDPNIKCVPSLIREGRCSLVTSFGIFKYMAGYSMTQFLIVCIITWPVVGETLSNFQFLYEDLILLTTLCFTFCFTGPSPSVDATAPMVSLVAMAPIASLLCSMSLNLGVMIFSYFYTQAQPWYESSDARDGTDADNGGDGALNYDQTVIFLITCSHFITMAIIFSKGSPHRASIFTNYIFLGNIFLCTAATTIMIFNRWDWWARLLLLRMPPSTAFQAIIFGVSFIHFFTSYLVEMYFVDGFVERWLQPRLSHLVFGETLQHKLMERTLQESPDWPPISQKSFTEVMEMELAAPRDPSTPSSVPPQRKASANAGATPIGGTFQPNGIVNPAFDLLDEIDFDVTVDETDAPKQHLLEEDKEEAAAAAAADDDEDNNDFILTRL